LAPAHFEKIPEPVSEELRRLADRRITIPRRGAGESLNVAVSAGIFLSTLK